MIPALEQFSHPVSASGSKAGRPCCSLPCSRRWCSWSCRSFACGLVEGEALGETGCGSCPPQTVRLPKKETVNSNKKTDAQTNASKTDYLNKTHLLIFGYLKFKKVFFFLYVVKQLPVFSEWSIWAIVIRCLFISSWRTKTNQCDIDE